MEGLAVEDMTKMFLDIMEILKCSVCLEVVKTSMVQCVRGHIICEQCKSMGECPLCKDHFSQVPVPHALRQAVQILPRRCKYSNCFNYILAISDHEKYCGYKPTGCKLCDWIGPGRELLNHVLDQHSTEAVLIESEPNVVWPNFNPKQKQTHYKLISAFNHLFWDESHNDPEVKKMSKTFHFIPNGKPQNDMLVEVAFTSPGPKFMCTIKLITDPDVKYDEENTIVVPNYLLTNFISDEKLMCSINIRMIPKVNDHSET